MSKKSKNKKRNNKNRSSRSILTAISIISLIIVGLFSVLALQYFLREDEIIEPPAPTPVALSVSFYFPDTISNNWVSEERSIEYPSESEIIQQVLVELISGPTSPTLNPSISNDIRIDYFRFVEEDNLLEIMFSPSFVDIAFVDRSIAIASLVHTLTSLPFIDSIFMFAGEEPLLLPDGSPMGKLTRDTIALEIPDDPVNLLEKIIILYFSDENALRLIPEERIININPILLDDNSELYHAILTELLAGPIRGDLFPTFPENIMFNRIERNGEVLTIDFDSDFANISLGSTGEIFMFYSLANTFTEIEEITRIQILIDGISIQDAEHRFHLDFSNPLKRDESLLE